MRTKFFALSSPRLRALGFLGLLLACGAVRAQTWDYDYSCIRFLDPLTGDPVTEYINNYTDASGNVYTNVLPVYVGLDPDMSDPIYLDPGFSLDITNVPGQGPIFGAPQPPPPPPNGGGPQPPPGGWGRWSGGLNKTTPITVINPPVGWFAVNRLNGNTIVQGLGNAGNNLVLPPGCWNFSSAAYIYGCNALVTNAPDGSFSDMNVIVGGGSYWPNSSPPSFYATVNWDLIYIGDSTNAFDGSGFGEVDVQCNADDYLSAVTPEGYTGCPEPSSLSLICIGALSLVARRHWRQKRKSQT